MNITTSCNNETAFSNFPIRQFDFIDRMNFSYFLVLFLNLVFQSYIFILMSCVRLSLLLSALNVP